MAFRSRTRRATRPRKKALWVNIPFGGLVVTETVGVQALVVPEDWEAQFTGNGNESAVLRAVVGELVWNQTAVGTAGGNGFWGIYIGGANEFASPPVFTVSGMSEVDWLRVGSRPTSSSVTDSKGANTYGAVQPIDIRAKRRLKSRDTIYICGQFGSDAASPSATIGGLLRFLIARD